MASPTTFGRDAVVHALSSTSDLAGLEVRVDDLLPHAQEVRLEPGDVLFREGDEAHALYLVVEGSVQVVVTGSGGRELVLARLAAGSVLGEQAVLAPTGGRRTATVRAAQPATLLRLDREAFRNAHPTGDAIHERLRELDAKRERDRLMRTAGLGSLLGHVEDAAERTLAAGEVLFRQGDDADSVYLVIAGTAVVYRERGEHRITIGRVQAGRCVGELALIRGAQRSATVVADTDLRVLEVDGARFLALLDASPALRDYMQALERVYQLPTRGIVTQLGGEVLGEHAITTLFHLADGRRFVASRVAAGNLYQLERVEPPPVAAELQAMSHGDVELVIDAAATIVRITSDGAWPDLAGAHLLAIDGAALTATQRETFLRTGELPVLTVPAARDDPDDPNAILCSCIQVTAGAVDDAIRDGSATTEELEQALGCGTVCGGCVPRIAERVGEAAWVPAEIVDEIHLTDAIRAFRLLPTGGRLARWRPGQHVVVSAHIDGHWVDRQYTITAAPGDATLEITVRREALGLFSNWMFDVRDREGRLRVSQPRGEPAWELGDEPALCFVAGIGVTPLVAACRALAGRPSAPIYVDYSGRRAAKLAYVEELRVRKDVTLDVRETAIDGRLSAADVRELVALQPGARVYVCGPHGYLRDVRLYLRTAGVASNRIHQEVFTHAGAPVASGTDGEPPPAATDPAAPDGSTDYEIAIRTKELLSLQVGPRDWAHPDHLLFQIVHQSSELWLKLAASELGRSVAHLRGREIAPTLRLLRRAAGCVENATAALDMLEQMSPWEYHEVRKALGQGSGFDSPGFRGVRDVSPQLGELFAALREDAGLTLLEVYTRGREYEQLYQLAEHLIEWDERVSLWRMRHFQVVGRILGGGAVGTQGTPVHVLGQLLFTSFYPELWQVRNELTAHSNLEPLPLASDDGA